MNKHQIAIFLTTATVTAIAIALGRIFGPDSARFFSAMAVFTIVYGGLNIWNHRTNEQADLRVKVENIDIERYKDIGFKSGRGAAIKAIQADHEGISKAHAQKLWREIIERERTRPRD